MTNTPTIPARDRNAIIDSLRAGVVPRRGHHHVQVGRANEIQALVDDIDRIATGSSAIRFVIGSYGSGKTFLLFLVRAIALERKLVTVHADLTPDRRLQASGGQARALYAELMRNLATRAKPDGGALPGLVERFVTQALKDARERGVGANTVIHEHLESLNEMTGGYDFAQVVDNYWRGHDTGNDELKSAAVRWLRGEFATKTDARKALGVRTIVDDDTFYDHLKLMARFTQLAGYTGLLTCLDEMVNLYKLAHTGARNANYEQILRILNDSLQGISVGLGFMLGGTPEFLTDTRKGLFSYEALQSRLAENRFAADGLQDFSGPVIRLSNLTKEDLYVLLMKIRDVFQAAPDVPELLPDEALAAFLAHCEKRIGAAYFSTPRNTIKEFVHLLATLEQNPDADWRQLLGNISVEEERNPDLEPLPEDAEAGDNGADGVAQGTAPDAGAAGTPTTTEPEPDDDLASFRL
jgi:hypothetical protein